MAAIAPWDSIGFQIIATTNATATAIGTAGQFGASQSRAT